jgi:hypothetical protein
VDAGVSKPAWQVSHQTRPRTMKLARGARRSRDAEEAVAASAHSAAARRRDARAEAIADTGQW